MKIKIRPLVLGRKNYLFAGSDDGAEHAAIYYSFFATCKINNINPFDWLLDVYQKISDYPENNIHELIPDKNYKLQGYVVPHTLICRNAISMIICECPCQ